MGGGLYEGGRWNMGGRRLMVDWGGSSAGVTAGGLTPVLLPACLRACLRSACIVLA